MDFIDTVRYELENINESIGRYQRILDGMRPDEGQLRLKRKNEYYIIEGEKAIYAHKSMMNRVARLKLRRYLRVAIKLMEENRIELMRIIKKWQPYSYTAVNRQLPRAYQGAFVPAAEEYYVNEVAPFTPSENPFYREELIHTTSFGLKVRTKSEMIIAEMLYSMGIPFCYEKEVFVEEEDGNLKAVYPDFAIPVGDGWYYIEHLGRLDLEGYRQRNAKKLEEYYRSGILMPGNLIFTMDGPDTELDAGPVRQFLESLILPQIRLFQAGKAC